MTKERDPLISAQVLLKTSSGAKPRDADLTADSIKAITPAPSVVSAAAETLARAGFDVGPVVGLSFSISARRSLFESYFGISKAGATHGEISLGQVPARIRQAVAAITFPPPPDFGPGSYS